MVQPNPGDNAQPSSEFVEVTPALAAEWLLLNVHNRSLSKIYVHALAADMERGEWDLNGEGVKFDLHNRLLDGQHRLEAIIECGLTVRMLVVRGLAANTQETMDRGKLRNVAGALELNNVANANAVAAALNWLNKMETGRPTSMDRTATVTPRRALVLLEQNPHLRDIGPILEPIRKLRLQPGIAWALGYRFSEIDGVAAKEFFATLGSGENLAADSPIYRLREFLIAELAKGAGKHRTKPWMVCALVIKAWNFWRDGTPVKQLKVRLHGKKPEAFPEPH